MGRTESKITNRMFLMAGLLLVLLSQIPYLVLGQGAAVPYHDQLDGELIAYIYQAKYLFTGQNIIPEFMQGASKTALCPPAPLAVLLFKMLPPFAAYLVMQTLGQLTAFAGMFSLMYKLLSYCKTRSGSREDEAVGDRTMGAKWIPFVTALFYAYLPFLPVYGLSQYGMPLLLLCIWRLYEGKKEKISMLYVAVYAAMSSLVLCGFAWLAIWAAALLILCVRRRLKEHRAFGAGFLAMLGVYVIENYALIGQMLGIGNAAVSHKSEYVLTGGAFLNTFWNYLGYNDAHSTDNHLWILFLALVLLVCIFICKKKCSARMRCAAGVACINLGLIVSLCLAAALWECAAGVSVREHLGAMGAFRLSRVIWLAPMLWQIELGFCVEILWNAKAWRRWTGYGISVAFLGMMAVLTLKNALVKPCLQQILQPDYDVISYEDYLAIGVMEQVEAFLAEEEGMQKEEYRVASLGIDPAAALYHGFYCVDGYSNNYDLAYKQAFRRVIAPELERSEYLRDYYDGWGNRCYLFSAECPGYYTVEKDGFFYSDLQIDTKALKEMGCDYLLSAAWVADAEKKNLKLLNEEGIETPGSYYRIFIYRIIS